ncbi:MAG: YdaS family helix-turn-helix protein [Methylococcaceae bacterium]
MEIFKFLEERGNQTMVASKFGISPQAVQFWLATKKVPAERIVELEKISGIPRAEIRPDIFGGV